METFCHKNSKHHWQLSNHILPRYKKTNKKTTDYTIVRFFYVAAEVDLQVLTNFLDQYAEIEGEPRYGTENIKKSNTKQEQLASKLHKL